MSGVRYDAAVTSPDASARPERIDSARLAAWTDFLNAHTRVMRLLERDLRESHGLTLAEYDVLHRLQSAPGHRMRMSEMAQALLYTTGGLTRLIDRMARNGTVAREVSPQDRRVVHAVLTPHGLATLTKAAGVHLRGLQRYFGVLLAEEELGPVSAFLSRLADPGPGP